MPKQELPVLCWWCRSARGPSVVREYDFHKVRCYKCGSSGPRAATPAQAVMEWNSGPGPGGRMRREGHEPVRGLFVAEDGESVPIERASLKSLFMALAGGNYDFRLAAARQLERRLDREEE